MHTNGNTPGQSEKLHDFFIAYASPDRPSAQQLSWFLQDKQCSVFLDVEVLRPGMHWELVIREALAASRAIVVLVSAHTERALYQQKEIVRAIQLARDTPAAHTVIPVILDKLPQDVRSMPYGMSSLQALNATLSGGLTRVAADLSDWRNNL